MFNFYFLFCYFFFFFFTVINISNKLVTFKYLMKRNIKWMTTSDLDRQLLESIKKKRNTSYSLNTCKEGIYCLSFRFTNFVVTIARKVDRYMDGNTLPTCKEYCTYNKYGNKKNKRFGTCFFLPQIRRRDRESEPKGVEILGKLIMILILITTDHWLKIKIIRIQFGK